MTAWIENGGGQATAQMFAWPTGGSNMTVNLPTAATWTEVQIANIQVTQGTAWVGFTISANSGQWANIESVSLTQN
jgi:hypothetical protein